MFTYTHLISFAELPIREDGPAKHVNRELFDEAVPFSSPSTPRQAGDGLQFQRDLEAYPRNL
jgi:hypothetical protein